MNMTIERINDIINNISFAPSNLDMGWEWQVKEIIIKETDSFETKGFLIRTSFKRPDTNTGEIGTGYGRWYTIPIDVSIDGVVKTAWMCAEQIVKHELMEAFLYENKRIFDPHKSIEDLQYNCREQI